MRHNCAPYTLFSTVFVPHGERLGGRWNRVRWGESHLVNSYGEVAEKVASIVADCTGRSDISATTFAGLDQLCDPRCKHFLHMVRPWCPECYLEARQQGIPAWDALYTYPRTTKVCIWHETLLRFSCPKCSLGQRFVPKFPLLDYCEHCGADLTIRPSDAEQTVPELPQLLWMARAALNMIEALGSGATLSTSNFFSNVRNLIEVYFGGCEQPFARRLGLAESSPNNWLHRGSAPSWTSLVNLGYRLNIPLSQLGSPELPLTDPAYWHDGPVQSLDRPHFRPTETKLHEIREALQKRLSIQDVASVRSLEGIPRMAKRLKVSPGTIKRHFPEEYAQLIDQGQRLRASTKELRERQKEERLAAAVAAAKESQLPATARNLKKTGKIKVSDIVTGSGRSNS